MDLINNNIMEEDIIKALDDDLNKGVYADTPKNRKLGRVGQEYGSSKGKKDSGEEKKKDDGKKDAVFDLAAKVYDKVDYKDLGNKNKVRSALKELGHSTDPLTVGTVMRRIQKEINDSK